MRKIVNEEALLGLCVRINFREAGFFNARVKATEAVHPAIRLVRGNAAGDTEPPAVKQRGAM